MSIASRVVPGRSWTTARSSPISRLNSVDLPTFGRPTSETENSSGSSLTGSSRFDDHFLRKVSDQRAEEITGAFAVQRTRRERLAETEPHELPDRGLMGGVIDLVRRSRVPVS